jgi:large subunit ribosomal protein L31
MAKPGNKKESSLDLGKKASKKDGIIETKDIPYHNITITCACGAEYEAGSTLEKIRVDICANCHPFYTGDSRVLDSEGRVEKFKKKYNLS